VQLFFVVSIQKLLKGLALSGLDGFVLQTIINQKKNVTKLNKTVARLQRSAEMSLRPQLLTPFLLDAVLIWQNNWSKGYKNMGYFFDIQVKRIGTVYVVVFIIMKRSIEKTRNLGPKAKYASHTICYVCGLSNYCDGYSYLFIYFIFIYIYIYIYIILGAADYSTGVFWSMRASRNNDILASAS
jgi:hypothetical protein